MALETNIVTNITEVSLTNTITNIISNGQFEQADAQITNAFMKTEFAINITEKFPLLKTIVLGNTLLAYLTSFFIFVICLVAVMIIHRVIINRLKALAEKAVSAIDDFILNLIKKNLLPLLYFGAFFLATRQLYLGNMLNKMINIIGVILLSFFLIRFISNIIHYMLVNYWMKKEKDENKLRTIKSLLPIINIIIWIIGVIFLLDNLGFDISSVVAGLGIGGIAVALAAQSLLGDLFSYFSILLDRPFELGDFIVIGEFMGTIEHIGLKTTRIRSLGGEQLIFSNTDLTSSRVRNYKRMEMRRVLFVFGVIYETPLEKLKKIPQIVKEIIESLGDETKFDRAHFARYGDFSLEFEVVYYVMTGDYNRYMDVHEIINLALFERFAAEGIQFAYPTQLLYVNQQDNQE